MTQIVIIQSPESPVQMTLIDALRAADAEMAAGRFQQSEIILRQILAAIPAQPQALQLLAKLAMHASRPEVAIQCFDVAIAGNPPANVLKLLHLDRGNVLISLGRMEDAINSYRRAIEIDPKHAGIHANLGVALHESGRPEEAMHAFKQAVELDPSLPEGYNNLGGSYAALGRYEEAARAYEKACELRPREFDGHANLACLLKQAGRIDEAIVEAKVALSIDPSRSFMHSNLLVFEQYRPDAAPKEIFESHRKWNQIYAAPLRNQIALHENDQSPERRLRVGYISPDLREHSVAFFFEGLLREHDPAVVETFCYADKLRKPDATSQRLASLSHHWINITGQSDQRVAEMIRADRIDILVDLSGHTSGPRLLVLARKPAPVQVSYLGYPNTTGMDAIDYSITDAHLDPPGESEQYFSETLVRLPQTFTCYTPPADAPPVGPLPAESRGYVTFASLNVLAKINTGVIDAWAKILQRLPASRLLMVTKGLQDPATADPLRSAFVARGIAPNRIEFAGSLPLQPYLALHHRIDILLDTFPINGHTITCHAGWMGVPPVCLRGHTHAGRLGTSVLHNLSLTELLANDVDEYISIAAALATDIPRLASLRSGMRQRMIDSPIMQHRDLARHIENAYRQMWHRYVGV